MDVELSVSTVQHLNEYIELLKTSTAMQLQGSVVRSLVVYPQRELTAKDYELFETVQRLASAMLGQMQTIQELATSGIRLLSGKVDLIEKLMKKH